MPFDVIVLCGQFFVTAITNPNLANLVLINQQDSSALRGTGATKYTLTPTTMMLSGGAKKSFKLFI